MLAPVLEALSKDDKLIAYAKVDIDVLPELANRFKVTSVPTVVALQNGQFRNQFVGPRDRKFIESFTQMALE